MTITLTWCILLCAISFLLGAMAEEIQNDRLEKAFCENLKELKEIHEEMEKGDVKWQMNQTGAY